MAEQPAADMTEVPNDGTTASRKDVVLKGLAVGLGMSLPFLLAQRQARAAAPRASRPHVDPAKNVSWEAWDNPQLDVPDGFDDWHTLLNPKGLPIYHDEFQKIGHTHPKHHWVMVIDLRKCIGCQSCVVACKSENNVPLGVYRTWVDVYQTGDTVPDARGDIVEDGRRYRQNVLVMNIPKLCNHCDQPPCVDVCPVKATYKREDGIVLVDPTLCIGCGTCVNACPYDARFLNPAVGVKPLGTDQHKKFTLPGYGGSSGGLIATRSGRTGGWGGPAAYRSGWRA